MENNLIRNLEERELRSDVSYDAERPAAEGIPNLITIIDDDDSNVPCIYISSDEEEVEDVIVLKDRDEDPEEGKYDGRYDSSLRAEGNEEAGEVAEFKEEGNEEGITDLIMTIDNDDSDVHPIYISSDEEEVEDVIVLEDRDEDPEEGKYDGRYDSSLRAEGNEEEGEVAERVEDENEEEREEAEDADDEREEEEDEVAEEEREEADGAGDEREEEEFDPGEFNGPLQWEFEDLDLFEDVFSDDSFSSDSGYSTMTSDEEDREDGDLDVEGAAPEEALAGGEAAEEQDFSIRPPPLDVLPSQNSLSFIRNALGEDALSTSGLSTSRDRNREEDLWGFYVTFLGEVPPTSGLGTSRQEGQVPSHNPDLWRCFGITADDQAPSTSGLSSSRKRSREEEEEEEEEEQEHPAQRPRKSSEEDLGEEPTPSTSGLNSWTQGVRPWEGIYPSRDSDSDYD